MYDFIAIGDAGVDTLVELGDASVHCTINKKQCELCLRYADKILVDGMVSKTAYNGMNAAVGAARLGLKTAIFATVGGDANGRRVLDVMKREGVSTDYVKVEKKLRTNASVVLNYKGERSILVYHEDYHYKLPKLDRTKWFYLTTMGKRWPSVYEGIARVVRKTGAKLSFNPGSHQLKAGAKKLKSVLEVTTVLFINKEEAQLFTKLGDKADFKMLLRAMRKLGAEIAVITDGPKGSYVHDGEKYYKLPIFPAPIVERTGAGDSFGTAFTVALCYGKDIREAMRWGTMDSAGVIQKIGPQDGLVKLADMRRVLAKNPRFQPKAF